MRNKKLFSKILISGLFLFGSGLELKAGEGDAVPEDAAAGNGKDATNLIDDKIGDLPPEGEKKEEAVKEEPAKEAEAKKDEAPKEEPKKEDELSKEEKPAEDKPLEAPAEAAPAAAPAIAEPAPPPAPPEPAPGEAAPPAAAPVAAAPAGGDGRVVRYVKTDNTPAFAQAGGTSGPVYSYAKGDPLLVKEQGEWAEINDHFFIKTSELSAKIVPRTPGNSWIKGAKGAASAEDDADDEGSDDDESDS